MANKKNKAGVTKEVTFNGKYYTWNLVEFNSDVNIISIYDGDNFVGSQEFQSYYTIYPTTVKRLLEDWVK